MVLHQFFLSNVNLCYRSLPFSYTVVVCFLKNKSTAGNRSFSTTCLADIEPMSIDSSVGFEQVGGHEKHILALKESIILPLMYPEVFSKFNVDPPRGVLFSGPPGK